MITVQFLGRPYRLEVVIDTYRSGGRAVELWEGEEPFADVSVYAHDGRHSFTEELIRRHPEAFYVQHWDFPDLITQLEQLGVIIPVPGEPEIQLGFVSGVRAYNLGDVL